MNIDTKTRTTKQGLRDLNFYGSRKKLAETIAPAEVSLVTTPPDALETAPTAPTAPDAPDADATISAP